MQSSGQLRVLPQGPPQVVVGGERMKKPRTWKKGEIRSWSKMVDVIPPRAGPIVNPNPTAAPMRPRFPARFSGGVTSAI